MQKAKLLREARILNPSPPRKSFRLVNKPMRRRPPAVNGNVAVTLVETFTQAAWLAGPSSVLRSRVTQKGMLGILDIPRAGAVLKHHTTQPNAAWWDLPGGICGICLVHYDEGDDTVETKLWQCFWCSDSTLCRGCVMPITITLQDERVSKTAEYRAKYEPLIELMMLRPNIQRELRVCPRCAISDGILTPQESRQRWPNGYRPFIDDEDVNNIYVMNYFHFEIAKDNRMDRVFSCSRFELARFCTFLRARAYNLNCGLA